MPRFVASSVTASYVLRSSVVFRVLIVWCIVFSSIGVQQRFAQPATAATEHEIFYADILESQRDIVIAATSDRLSQYTMVLEFAPDKRSISGTLHVDFVNTTGGPLREIYFRLYPNADHYGDGALDVTNVTVADAPVTVETSIQDTVLRVPLDSVFPSGLPNTARVSITMDMAVTVPANSTGSYGIFSYATGSNTWVLADWHPVLAAYEADEGWQLDPPLGTVDPTFAESALYDVTLTYPEGWVVATSGIALPDESAPNMTEGSQRTDRFIAGPVREFTMAIDDDYEIQEITVGETVIRVYANPGRVEPLRDALDVAEAALAQYNERFGPYPYAELDLVDTPLTSGVLGVSWGGIVFLDSTSLAAQHGNRGFYDFLIAHEIAHQWWGGVVGVNSNDHTFIAEGLTNYVMTMFVEWDQGPDAAVIMLESSVASRYLRLLRSSGDAVVDIPWEQGGPGFSDLVYGKAALGFLAIRMEIGDEAFLTALRNLTTPGDGFGFAIADPEDFLAAFEEAGGVELDALWSSWFLEANTTPADVEALLMSYREYVREPAAA